MVQIVFTERTRFLMDSKAAADNTLLFEALAANQVCGGPAPFRCITLMKSFETMCWPSIGSEVISELRNLSLAKCAGAVSAWQSIALQHHHMLCGMHLSPPLQSPQLASNMFDDALSWHRMQ